MTTRPISLDLKNAKLPLASIYLDPNNPRFVTPGSELVPSHLIDKPEMQEEARRKLIRMFNVEELRLSMQVNGYLPLDRIVVKEFKAGSYVVLEGNRRICAAKLVDKYTGDGTALRADVLRSLVKIPCLIYTGNDPNAAWILQGLRHLSGVQEWPPYNKAKLLVEQMEKEGLSVAEFGRKFATKTTSARYWASAYYAFKLAQESPDYPGVVNEAVFTYFQELFSRSNSAVRNWLGWDGSNFEFKNKVRFNEFIGWIDHKTKGGGDGTGRGDFDSRHLPRAIDIRDVSNLIRDDPKTFKQFRQDRDIDKARSNARTRRDGKKGKAAADQFARVLDAVSLCTRLLKNNPYRLAKDEKSKTRLRKELDGLGKVLAAVSEGGEHAGSGRDETPIVRH